MSNILVYTLDGKVYINLTNRCTNDCIFCLRNDKDDVCGQTLWLDSEDFTAGDVIEQYEEILRSAQNEGKHLADEVVFCGYGEPMLKLAILKEVCQYLKDNYPKIKIRVNTNGMGNVINNRNILPEITNLVDEVSISLNAPNEEQYETISKPQVKNAYKEMLEFAKYCVDNEIKTTLTVVSNHPDYKLDIEACKKIADEIGAEFRVREWLNNGY